MRVLLTVLVVATLAAPLPAAAPESYFPLPVGATWVRRADDGVEITSKVVGTKTVRTTECVVLETKTARGIGGRTIRACYEQSPEGVRALETQGLGITLVLDPPRPILQLPPEAGKTWSWTPKNIPFSMTVTETWQSMETVRVPAGTFSAWKLQSVFKRGPTVETTYTWYASGVGIVKIVREQNGERDPQGSSELVSYRLP